MKLDARRVEAFLATPDPAVAAVLIYGPDAGLVSERALTLVRKVAGSESDPFRVAELTVSSLREDPARLADEAAAIAFGGGRRAIRVPAATDSLSSIFGPWLESGPVGDSLVVLEAGSLGRNSSLRKLFEQADRAAALPCYADEGRGLGEVIRKTLAEQGVGIEGEASEYLAANLGADRMITKAELTKLALYMGGSGKVTIEDAMAVVGDSGAVSLDAVTEAVGLGDQAALEIALRRALLEGNSPVGLLRVVARHFQRLHYAAGIVGQGRSPQQAVQALRPPIFMRSAQESFALQLRRWPADRLASVLAMLTEAELDCKTSGPPPEAVTGRVLMRIASAARAR
jgi:DNA polymerase-3 subunit delta